MNGVDRGALSVGALRVLAAEASDAGLRREFELALDACFAPIRLQVSGRAGVGKSSVRAVLTTPAAPTFDAGLDGQLDDVEITETAALDVPLSPDPVLDGDVLVYVLASGAQPVDADVVASAANVVSVLAKADTVDDVAGVVARLSATVGSPVVPLMGTMARTVLAGGPATFEPLRGAVRQLNDDVLLTPERFMSAELPLTASERHELVEQIEICGVRAVVDALRADPSADDPKLRRMLREMSGVTEFAAAVRRALAGVRADRQGRLLHRLTQLAVEYPDASEGIQTYLASDEAVLAAMSSAMSAVDEAPRDGVSALESAKAWAERSRNTADPNDRRAALAVSRGYLRMQS